MGSLTRTYLILRARVCKRMCTGITFCVFAMTTLFFFVSCDYNTPYYRFAHAPLQGWDKNDTITFDVPPIQRAGKYDVVLGVRSSVKYPFTTLAIIVEQTIYPRIAVIRDTLVFPVTNYEGNPTGSGLTLYLNEIPLNHPIGIHPGDSIHYAIRHNMKRGVIPGISDVGIKLTRKN